MNYVRMVTPKDQTGKSGRAPGGKPGEAFDLWLQRGLHRIFDDVASEPIPDELLRLIEEDRERSSSSG